MNRLYECIFAMTLTLCICTQFAARPPAVVRQTEGSSRWETYVDYSDPARWLSVADNGKAVDVIYFYPTSYSKPGEDSPEICAIDDPEMMAEAATAYALQATVFSESCNIYAPYYRQADAEYILSLEIDERDRFMRYLSLQDPADALDYYFENFNNGKPFILAGHSQGSQVLLTILSDYMRAHPEYYGRMIAAYVIGYSVTRDYMAANPHLKFARRADDTGVIISYNTVGPGNSGHENGVVLPGALAINPLNWQRGGAYASAAENPGSLNHENDPVEGLADARLDTGRGVVICTSVDAEKYAVPAGGEEFFGPESYHRHDYGFYYVSLQQNVAQRIAAYMDAQ